MARFIPQPIRQHSEGVYRMTLVDSAGRRDFAQFIKGRYYDNARWGESFVDDPKGKWWRVEIREIATGALQRHAGIWKSRADAVAEVLQ